MSIELQAFSYMFLLLLTTIILIPLGMVMIGAKYFDKTSGKRVVWGLVIVAYYLILSYVFPYLQIERLQPKQVQTYECKILTKLSWDK